MPASTSADLTARFLLRCAQEPSRYRTEAHGAEAPLVDTDVVMRLALGRHVRLADAVLDGVAAGALRAAALGYVREVFFHRDASPYQTLGLAVEASPAAIRERFRLLMLLVHPDRQQPGVDWPDRCAAQANRAYAILRDPEARAAYDRERVAKETAVEAARQAGMAKARPLAPAPGHGVVVRQWRPPPRPLPPEWLTARVGGWVREHPAATAFALLLGGAALVTGTVALWESESASLVRAPPRPPAAASTASLPVTPAASPLPEVTAPEAVPPVAAAPEAVPPVAAAPVVPVAAAPAVVVVATAKPAVPLSVAPKASPVAPPPAIAMPIDMAPLPLRPGLASHPAPRPAVAVFAAPAPAREAPRAARADEEVAARAAPAPPAAPGAAPSSDEIEAFFARFVDAYAGGRADAIAAMFDADAKVNERQGRAAIRNEYAEVFRQSAWRRLQLTRIHWRRAGDAARATGEAVTTIDWGDGREVTQRFQIGVELVRRDGHVLITRLTRGPGATP
ncbi:MAG: DnaJ domain-containing protein [Burkholderiales bacterium]|nr:DnaJ domain-containing protein [Burkholderiales bacterium]